MIKWCVKPIKRKNITGRWFGRNLPTLVKLKSGVDFSLYYLIAFFFKAILLY